MKIVHTNSEDQIIATYPFGTNLVEIVLQKGEAIFVRDENDNDFLVVAQAVQS